MSRFFVNEENIESNMINITNKEDVHHIIKVLRLKEKDIINISDSFKWEYKCEISYIDSQIVKCEILDKQTFAKEPAIEVTLFQGVPKQGKMDITVQKTTELGINTIIPVFMDRTIISDKGNFKKKINRYQSIAGEAAKQCGRGLVPKVEDAIDFKEMLSKLCKFDLIVFPYENEENFTIKNKLKEKEIKGKKIAIIIGPEGGFSDNEVKLLKDESVVPVTLGKTILRTETAGIVALSMVMYELEL